MNTLTLTRSSAVPTLPAPNRAAQVVAERIEALPTYPRPAQVEMVLLAVGQAEKERPARVLRGQLALIRALCTAWQTAWNRGATAPEMRANVEDLRAAGKALRLILAALDARHEEQERRECDLWAERLELEALRDAMDRDVERLGGAE